MHTIREYIISVGNVRTPLYHLEGKSCSPILREEGKYSGGYLLLKSVCAVIQTVERALIMS